MGNKGKGFLALLAFFLLLLALKPSLIGTTGGAISQDFENVWVGLGIPGQMIIVMLVLIVIIALVIGKNN